MGGAASEGRAYNNRNQTVAITGLNSTLTPIGYLDSGQSERTDAGGSHDVNSSLGVGSETKGGQTTYHTRTPSGHLVSRRTPAGAYDYRFDGLGSVVGLVDAVGDQGGAVRLRPLRPDDHQALAGHEPDPADGGGRQPLPLHRQGVAPILQRQPTIRGRGDQGAVTR